MRSNSNRVANLEEEASMACAKDVVSHNCNISKQNELQDIP